MIPPRPPGDSIPSPSARSRHGDGPLVGAAPCPWESTLPRAPRRGTARASRSRAHSPRAARWAAAFVLLAAWSSPAVAQDWEWAEGQTVQAVEWRGLRSLNQVDAQAMIATRAGEPFHADRLALDVGRLYRSGRFGPTPDGKPPVSVEVVQADEGSVRVIFEVNERPRVVDMEVSGFGDAIDQDELDKLITTREGALYDAFSLERDARAVREKLRDEGYAFAEVTPSVSTVEGGVRVALRVRPGPKVYVEEIIYEGAKQLDPSILLDAEGPDALEVKEREVFGFLEEGIYKPEAFERDLDRIARYYRSQGFLDARVYKEEERYSLDGEALTLVVRVEEGTRYTIRRVGVEGTRVIDGDRLLETLELKPGRPFLGEDLRKAVEKIRHVYGQRAYVHAVVDVDVEYDLERHMLDIVLRVTEGPKVRIEKIRIEGNDKTKEEVIRRELSFYPGEYFDADEVQASIGRLGRLRFFSDVRVDFAKGSQPGREDLILSVEEARTGSFVLGGGVSTSAGFFGNISLTQRNFDLFDPPTSWREFVEGRAFTGAGQSLTISAQPGRERSQYSVEFTEPYLFGYPIILGLEGAVRDRQREDWLERRRLLRVSLGYRLLPDLMLRATYRIERVRVTDVEFDAPSDVHEVTGTNYVGALRLSLTYNQNLVDRDFVLYGGYSVSVYYEYSGPELGSDFYFHRAGIEANWQTSVLSWPRHHKWVFALRGELGWQRELKPSDEIPIFERFFAGGPNSVRGFRFRTVGPRENGKPIGGNFLLIGTAEFSFPVFQDLLRGVLFADAGTVIPEYTPGPSPRLGRGVRDYFRDEIRVAAGFGLRIKVPFFPAPVQLDFAWPLQDKRDDDRQVFSFSVGFGF
ncbi:MAG: outer membrane protein assembly factor [Planctomycetota bacterium]|nr:MAG: outer membrane protein assembly factor [Planctomycetota bacterium]